MSETTASPSAIKPVWFVWTLAAFALFALIAAYSSRMTYDYTDYDKQRAIERYATLAKLNEEANKTLTTVAWVDQDKKIIRIPIDEAMAKELDTLKGQPAQMGCPIAGAIPPPAATNAPPAAPATPPPAKPNP